jgi:hypothetical protein
MVRSSFDWIAQAIPAAGASSSCVTQGLAASGDREKCRIPTEKSGARAMAMAMAAASVYWHRDVEKLGGADVRGYEESGL